MLHPTYPVGAVHFQKYSILHFPKFKSFLTKKYQPLQTEN